MKNPDSWKPTKVVRRGDGFRPTSDPRFLAVSSRLMALRQIEHYQRVIPQYSSGRLLDLGCGDVPYYELYKDVVQEVICVDWDNSFHASQFLDYSMDLNEPLSLESQSFDTVLLTDVLEHIYHPAQLLSEVARVLRQRGRLILAVPFLYWVHERPYDFYRYTEFALRQMSEESGFEIISLDPYGGAPEVVADILGKCLWSAKLAGLCRVHTAFCCAVLGLKLFRRLSQKSAGCLPLGYVLVAQKIR